MIKIRKIAALLSAVCAVTVLACGCRNDKKIADEYDTIKSGCEAITSLASGEIMIYETYKPEKEIEGKILLKTAETYVKFVNNGTLEYDYTTNEKSLTSGDVTLFEATRADGSLVVSRDGVVVDESEEPDIFENFKVSYAASDVEDVEVVEGSSGTKVRILNMTSSFADSFDKTVDGVQYECKKIAYNYYFDADGSITNIVSEYTYHVTCGDESQTLIHFAQSKIEET